MKTARILIYIMALAACSSKIERENAPEDIASAGKTGENLYQRLSLSDYDSALKLFDSSFIAQSGREKIINMLFDSSSKEWGVIKEYTLTEGLSNVSFINEKKLGEYELNYLVKREKSTTNEKIVLEDNNKSQIVIVGYYITPLFESTKLDSSR